MVSSTKPSMRFASGVSLGPVALVCLTITVLSFLAMFLLLVLFGDQGKVAQWIKPMIPVLAVVGTSATLWFKAHTVQATSTQQNTQIDEHVEQVHDQLNGGGLDAKIKDAVITAINDPQVTDKINPKENDH